jgi:hypothetical protein
MEARLRNAGFDKSRCLAETFRPVGCRRLSRQGLNFNREGKIMKPSVRIALRVAAVLASAVLGLASVISASANSNNQAILSGTGIPTTAAGPAGFWIWSQPGGNAYGNEGAGSIYFYALLPAEHPVDVSNVSINGDIVSETVNSTDGLISCPTFTGTETSPGVGTVSFTCSVKTAKGPVTAVAANVPAQVNISSST